jgi:putative peptidoglycan binding protein
MAILKKGSKGSDVKKLQIQLNKLKAKPKLAEDGIFGPKTLEAVKAFQKKAKLKPDGLVGDLTRAALAAGGKVPEKKPKLDFKNKTQRMDFEIKGSNKTIWVRQYWAYTYTTKSGASAWTSNGKKNFHKELEKVIRKAWSGKFVLSVSGTSEFAKYFKDQTFDVKFDVDPKSSGAHWAVKAVKVPKGQFNGSVVNWSKREMTLDTEDMNEIDKGGGPGVKQSGAAHEFGHALGNSKHAGASGHGDEYKNTSAYKAHKKSIMHSGMKLKKRHADHLVTELNKMIPNTQFSVKSVK